MARIVLSDLAPSDAKKFSLGNYVIEVPETTTDPGLISEAVTHPWLSVERDEAENIVGAFTDISVAREDDVLAFENSVANDPKEIAKVEEAKVVARGDVTAIDAGLDQDKVIEVEDVNVTLAADDADTPDTTTTRRKTAAKE